MEKDYKYMSDADLEQAVCEECDKDTILENALGYVGEDCWREFLLACLGEDVY